MRHDQKPPGMTLAEALGLDVPDDAPGGQKLEAPVGGSSGRSTRLRQTGIDIEYDGFVDIDGYNSPRRGD